MAKRLEEGQSPTRGQQYAAAVLSMKQGDFQKGEQILLEVVQNAPDFARAHLRLSDLRIMVPDTAGAKRALEKAFALSPARSLEKLRYPEFLAQQGKTVDARGLVESVLSEAPDYLPASLMLGTIAVREKKYPEALKALEDVLRRDPNHLQARILQAQIQVAQKNLSAAVENLERIAKAHPKFAMAHFELGRAYALSGRLSEAMESLGVAVALNPLAIEARMSLAELGLRNGQPQAALDALREVINRAPKFIPAQSLQAAALRALNRPADAEAIYRKHTELFPNKVDSWRQLGVVLREQRKFDDANAAFERALKLEPQDTSTVNSLVELDLISQKFSAAMARLAALDEKTRATAEARVIEARIHAAQKKWPEAEAALVQAVQLNPDLDIARQLLIGLYVENGRFDEAVSRLEEKLGRNPDDSGSRLLLAGLYEQKRDFAKARAAYEQILARRSDSFVALNNLAYLLAEQFADLPRAEELARQARQVGPENPMAGDTLGWILYRRGDFDGALNILRECVARLEASTARADFSAEIYYHLGMAYSAMGNAEQAKAAFGKATAGGRDFPSKMSAAEQLALLKPVSEGGLSIDRLRELAREKPNDPAVHLRLAEALEGDGKKAEAIATYEQALKANAKLAGAALGLARIYVTDDRAKAVEFAKRARDIAPSDAGLAAKLGVVAAIAGELNWAYSLLQQGTGQPNAAPAHLLEFAKVAYRLGKGSEAKQALDRAVAANVPAEVVALAKSYARLIELANAPTIPDEVIPEVAGVLKADGKNLPALMAEASALMGKKDSKAAAAKYESILQTFPGFPLAQSRLAAALLESGGSWEKAHELASACRAAVPTDAIAALVLGETYYRKKEYSRCAELLTEAARARPLDAKRLFLLGGAYFEMKNNARSEEALKQALAAGLQSPEREQAEAMLKQMKG